MNGLITVIISTYNRKKFLEYFSIPSVVNQTYQNIELIIVDDASDDGKELVIKHLKQKFARRFFRFYYLRFSRNRGYAETINAGLKLSKGQYIALLDADDAWFPSKLEKQIYFMKQRNLLFSTTLVYQYNLLKNKLDGIAEIGLPGFMAKKEGLLSIFPIDNKLRDIEDSNIFIKVNLL